MKNLVLNKDNYYSFDLDKVLHRKLLLEMIKSNITILNEMQNRNSGNLKYENNHHIEANTIDIPTIKESINMYKDN